MADPLDFTEQYKNNVRPEINRRLKKLFLSFAGIIILLFTASKIIDYFKLPDRLIFILFFPCAAFYLYQIFSFKEILCPRCKKPLFNVMSIKKISLISKSHVSKYCQHCGAKLR